jgi:hypothetical protein
MVHAFSDRTISCGYNIEPAGNGAVKNNISTDVLAAFSLLQELAAIELRTVASGTAG